MRHAIQLTAGAFVFMALVIGTGRASADDWPQWRGPQRDGISKETGLLKEWPKDGPKLLWQVKDVGTGYSTPSVVGERLYLLGNKGNEDEFVESRATADGKPVWHRHVGAVGNPNQQPNYPAARSTPTVDGESLYALGSDGDLVCLETASGNVRWQKNLRKDFGGQPDTWAYAESPLVDGDAVVCTPGGATATIVALNKKSGDVIWKCAVPGGDQAAYSSILITDAGGIRQYIQFLQKGVVGIDANTGKFLWRYEQTAKGSPANIPTPVAHDSYVYSGTSMGGAGLVKLEESGGEVQPTQVYFNKRLPTAIGGAVLVGNDLYGTSSVLQCLQFTTGAVKWTNRSVGSASVLYADGRLYLHGEDGEVALVDASPDGYHERGRFTPPGEPENRVGKAWAYPVVANGRLYIRDANCLWCYDVKQGK